MSRSWRGRSLSLGTTLTQTPRDLDLSKKGLGRLCLRGISPGALWPFIFWDRIFLRWCLFSCLRSWVASKVVLPMRWVSLRWAYVAPAPATLASALRD